MRYGFIWFPNCSFAARIYKAHLNPENPLGTMQSIEHVLRGFEKALADERDRLQRAEKMLVEFEEQAGKPFPHEARLKELIVRQAELNAALDLDKGEQQAAPDDPVGNGDAENKPSQRRTGRANDAIHPRREKWVRIDPTGGDHADCHYAEAEPTEEEAIVGERGPAGPSF